MDKQQDEMAWEKHHLEQTIALADSQLQQAIRDNEGNRGELSALRQEMRENAAHSLSGFSSSQDFEDLVEISQYNNPIIQKIADYETVEKKITVLERLLESPYFARIDFLFEGDSDSEKIYIGRSSLIRDDSYEIVVYDWRSPVAGLFYRFTVGAAFYDAPVGRVRGEVQRKRQYEIRKGTLEYFFDAELQIIDTFLRELLSQNTSPAMKTIVETIQKEQDIVIRDMENDLVMVQGAVGSGKTSIALHRAAYLMYQGLSSKLAAHNILVLSPNTLFEQYISQVLPELGEENVVSLVFEEMLSSIIGRKAIQSRNQYLEKCLTNAIEKRLMKQSMELKTSFLFMELLDRFVEDIPYRWIDFHDIYYGSQCIVKKETLIKKTGAAEKGSPLRLRLKLLEEYVMESAGEIHRRLADTVEYARIKKEMRALSELDVYSLYLRLIGDEAYFYQLAEGLPLPAYTEDILRYTKEKLSYRMPAYDDAAVLAFLQLRLADVDRYKNIKQVVIDEAQDYYPLHYAICGRLFTNAKYTVLGDFNQTIEKKEDISFYQQIDRILGKEKSSLVVMDKSFRCTNEILRFSMQFITQKEEIKSFNRKGEEPEIHAASDQAALCQMIRAEATLCQEKGYQSVGLLCKTEKNARSLYKQLKDSIDIRMVHSESATKLQGLLVLPIYLSKGLEFDAVLICDANQENYHTEEDQKLLYVACTRALHRLKLFYKGEASRLLRTAGMGEE